MRFIARPFLAFGFLVFGLTNAFVIGGLLMWTQKLKFLNFGIYVKLGGEDTGIILIAMIFALIDFGIGIIGIYLLKHLEVFQDFDKQDEKNN